jgi:DnaJ-class molecular chaperone
MNSAKIVQVQIPQGVTAGSQLHVQIEDGRLFTIIVPEGMHPGDMLAVEIHEDAGKIIKYYNK